MYRKEMKLLYYSAQDCETFEIKIPISKEYQLIQSLSIFKIVEHGKMELVLRWVTSELSFV